MMFTVQTVLFIYIATAATLFLFFFKNCFRRCCHFFSPKDKYFILVLFSQISEIIMQISTRFTKYRGRKSEREQKASERWSDAEESAGRLALKCTNSHRLNE